MSIQSIEGYKRLGVSESDTLAQPQITPQLRMIAKTIRRAGQPRVEKRTRKVNTGVDSTDQIESRVTVDDVHAAPYGPGADLLHSWPQYLHASDSPDARKILLAYYSIGATWRRHLPIEAFCLAAGVPPIRALSLITASVVQMGANASTVILAISHPAVVQKTVEMALTDEGIEDRNTLHKASGFLPSPKGSQTTINVANNANASSSAAAAALPAPAPEDTIRRLVDQFNARTGRELPAAPAPVHDTLGIPHADAREPVTVDAEFDEEE